MILRRSVSELSDRLLLGPFLAWIRAGFGAIPGKLPFPPPLKPVSYPTLCTRLKSLVKNHALML